MASKVVLLSSAEDDFRALSQVLRIRIAKALRDLADFPIHRTGIKKLKPPFEGYRKRNGDFRTLFDVEGNTVFAHRIKNRKDA